MAVPPATADVEGRPPDPSPTDNHGFHSMSFSEIAATNHFIQTAIVESSQLPKSSSTASGFTKIFHFPSIVTHLQPDGSLNQKSSSKAADDKNPFPRASSTAFGKNSPMHDKQPTTTSQPSFAEVAKNGSLNNKRKSGSSMHIFGRPTPLPGAKTISKDGIDISVFENEATDQLAAPYQWTLIGKFSHKIPNSQSVSMFFSKLKLHGKYEFQWLSHRQILIVLSEEEDYALIWTKGFWLINGCSMRTFKWTPTYNARFESPFAPVWITLPGLPIHLFEKRALHLLASQIGRPVMVDSLTASRKRASMARICVDINLLSPLKKVINLCINGCLIEQIVIYENVPSYCDHCRHIGHGVDKCFVKFKELKSVYEDRQAEKRRKFKGKSKMEGAVELVHDSKSMQSTVLVKSGSEVTVHLLGNALVVGELAREEGEIVDVGLKSGIDDLHATVEEGVVALASAAETVSFDSQPKPCTDVVNSVNGVLAMDLEHAGEEGEILEEGSHHEVSQCYIKSVDLKPPQKPKDKSNAPNSVQLQLVKGLLVDKEKQKQGKENVDKNKLQQSAKKGHKGVLSDNEKLKVQSDSRVLGFHSSNPFQPLENEGDDPEILDKGKVKVGQGSVLKMNDQQYLHSAAETSSGHVESNALKPTLLTEDRSTAIVKFLTPFGVGSNMASVMESDPVALIKFLDKHPSMELYWDENSVLQCVDKDSGEYIEYAGVNSSERQKFIEPPTLSNQTIIFAEPLQTIYQPHCYYPDMDALRAHLIPESDASECSLDDSDLDSEDSLLISGYDNAAFNSVYDGSGNVGDNSGYGGRVTRSMAKKNVVPVVEADVVVISEALQGQPNSLNEGSTINQAEFCAKPLQIIYPDKNEQINDVDDEDESEFDDEMIMQALFKRCPTPDNTKSVFKDNFFAGYEGRITRSKAKLF